MITIYHTYTDYKGNRVTDKAASKDLAGVLNFIDEDVDTPHPQAVIVYHERSKLLGPDLLHPNKKTGIAWLDKKSRESDEFPEFHLIRGDRNLYGRLEMLYGKREDRLIALELIQSVYITECKSYEDACKCIAEFSKKSSIATNGV